MDIQLHYIEKGSGDPLILLHGNGENSGYFEHQTNFFSDRYRVIAVDTRGHGQSPRGTADFTITQFAEDLHDLLDELSIERADILGFSDGANIALTFAMKYPEYVKRLVLNGGNLFPQGVKPSVQIPIVIGYYLTKLFPKAKHNHELLALMVDEPHIDPKALHNLNIPTLVIAGTNDMIKEKHTRLIAESIPSAQLKIIEGTHFIAHDSPDEFNKAVSEFLK